MILLHVLLAVGQAAFPQEPPLIGVPEGWRHERLDFPLDFAPEIEFRGFEDLSFAPGMFDPGSDSYFSYALALKLEGDVEVEERMLARFLESYYRGLYRAVATERKLQTEGRPTRASVRRDGANFRASVQTFDPFTTGAALALELEIGVHSAPRATEVLGLASPKPADAPIWKELRALAEAWRSARPAPVFLNHVYAVVDRETYDAMVRSSFLREAFAVSEERATRRADISYSGLYFYGRRTYFEFLPPDAAAGFVVGSSGLALGVESPQAIDEFAARLAKQSIQSQGGPITREVAGKQVPWFRILGLQMPASPLSVFAMEYDPQFLKQWNAELPPLDAGIARADVLARYAASLKKAGLHASSPLADVLQVELAVSDAQRESLTKVFAAAGSEIGSAGGLWTIHAPQWRLILRSSEQPGGVTAIELSLREPIEREPMQLGRARLSFAGRTATITLGP